MGKQKSKPLNAVSARARVAPKKRAVTKQKSVAKPPERGPRKITAKPYDADRSAGMIPGLAKRMKEYLRTMRDDR